MKVGLFGIYDPTYARTKVITAGLERNGHTVLSFRVNPREFKGLSKYRELRRVAKDAKASGCDRIIVGFPGQTVIPFARLWLGRHIIFDAFLSLYDSNVCDRKVYGERSLRGMRDWLLDWLSIRLAEKVLLDTNEHIDYFVKEFGGRRDKFIRVWIGADDAVFYPRPQRSHPKFIAHFHGTFIPLQGIEYILEAAFILKFKDIHFRIVGGGQESDAIEAQAKRLGLANVEFTGKVPIERVPEYMAEADVVLGIFGKTHKTRRVIPNKVYEAMAMGKAIITADTPAMRELCNGSDVYMVPVANAEALARAIGELADSPNTRRELEAASRRLFETKLKPQEIVKAIGL
jgi:glycosyltransferase involved in cell wall biosynthesis